MSVPCRWYSFCSHKAVALVRHPKVLSGVPTCAVCMGLGGVKSEMIIKWFGPEERPEHTHA